MSWIEIEPSVYGQVFEPNPQKIVNVVELQAKINDITDWLASGWLDRDFVNELLLIGIIDEGYKHKTPTEYYEAEKNKLQNLLTEITGI